MKNSFKAGTRSGRSRHRSRRRNNSSGGGYGSPSRRRGGYRRQRRFQGNYISPDKFINKNPVVAIQKEYEAVHTFADFGFSDNLVQNLLAKGFTRPTQIQDQAIPHILNQQNVLGLANTGSGKTAAFVLPIIELLERGTRGSNALIITPTRELASQINDEFRSFSRGMKLMSALCVGGVNIRPQIRSLSQNPHVIIGTPGRLKDLFQQKALKLSGTKILVLDEADRMLDMGFQKDIEFLLDKLPVQKQSLYFSATINPSVKSLMDQHSSNIVTVSVRTSETGEHIAQDIVRVGHESEKFPTLKGMLSKEDVQKVLIFCEMKHATQKLARDLMRSGFPAEAIHGNKTQSQRQRALDAFKSDRVKILVATDVAARGLDIPNVSHVINYDKPHSHDDYIHRIGRTGRAGKGGQAYTFIL